MPRASALPDDIEQFSFGEHTNKCARLPLEGLTEALATEYIRACARPKWLHEGERNKLIQTARSYPGSWIRYVGSNGFDKSLARRIGRIVDGRSGVKWAEVDAALDGKEGRAVPWTGLQCKAQERPFIDCFKTGDFRFRILGLRARAASTAPTAPKERPTSPSLKRDRETAQPDENLEVVLPAKKAKKAKQAKQAKKVESRGKGWVQKLNSMQQTMLYCGHNQDLWKYLKKRNLEKHNSLAAWKGIREWTYTPKGREWLKSAGMTPEGVALDHIHAKAGGRIDHAYNCFLMPTSVNSYFKDRWDKEKQEYIGELASATASRFVKWYIEAARKHQIDCSKFSGAGV